MNLVARFNLLLHACAVLGTLSFCVADDKPLLGLLALVGILGSLWLTWGPRAGRPPALPRTMINLLVFAAIINAALRAMGNTLNEEFVSTLGQFLVFIVLFKLLDRRGPRDDAQLITLTIFISVASVLTSGSLPVGVLLMAYVPTVVASAMMWQLRAGQVMLAADAAAIAPPRGQIAATPPPPLPIGRRFRRGFVGVCTVAVLVSCAMATTGFVLIPRGVGSELFGRFGMQPQAAMGFRESVRLGESGFLSENPLPVMDVQITTQAGNPLGAAGETLYLRGAARDEYDAENRVWQDPSAGRSDENGAPSTERVQELREYNIAIRGTIPRRTSTGNSTLATRIQKITMRAESAGGTMFCLWRPLTMTPDRQTDVFFSRRNGTMRHTSGVGQRFTYTITSTIADETSWPPRPPTGFRTGRIHDLTADVLRQRSFDANAPTISSRQVISAIQNYLRTNYSYTLEMVAPPENQDPIEFFLFDRKKGHCEYFASAMAAMCQSQGIPCRVITGYVATEFNSLTGAYLVRESNAHAWVEAFVTTDPETGNGRWETFDASPPGDIERIHRPPAGLLASLRSWYDALEFGWSSSVIGYDNATSSRGRSGRYSETELAGRFTSWADELVARLKTIRSDPMSIPRWLRYSPIGLVFLVGVWIVLRPKLPRLSLGARRKDPRPTYGITPFRPTGAYAKALRALQRAGLPKPEHTPPELFAARLAVASPEAAAHLRGIAQSLYRTHFGNQPQTQADIDAMYHHVQALEAALRTLPRRDTRAPTARPTPV